MHGLLPCPFCGNSIPRVHMTLKNAVWIAHCFTCDCEGPVSDSEAGAVAAWNRRPDTATITRQADAARAMHLASVTALTGLIEALAPLVKLDPEGEVGEWAEKIRQRAAEWDALQDRAAGLQLKLDLLTSAVEATALRMPVLNGTHPAYAGDPLVYIGAVAGALAAERNQAREDLADERARANNARQTLALVSGAPRRMDATWDELVKHVGDLRPASDPPVLTEAEMEARAAAWEERAERIHRIEALWPAVALDPLIAEERAAAIAHHERVNAELTRFALTGVL